MPWEKGQSGNPDGRPKKGKTYTDAIRAKFTPEELAKELESLILAHSFSALKYAYDRLEGTPKQHVEMSNEKEAEWLELHKSIDDKIIEKARQDIDKLSDRSSEDTDT